MLSRQKIVRKMLSRSRSGPVPSAARRNAILRGTVLLNSQRHVTTAASDVCVYGVLSPTFAIANI